MKEMNINIQIPRRPKWIPGIKPKDFEENTPYVGLEHLSIKSIVIKDCGTVEDVESDLTEKIADYLEN